jgi:hypothetical protein
MKINEEPERLLGGVQRVLETMAVSYAACVQTAEIVLS